MALEFTHSYLKDSLAVFRYGKSLADRAMAQVTDEQLVAVLDEESNSIALIVKHMAGNMKSRWTGFLTTDGEKPDRQGISSLSILRPLARRCWHFGKRDGTASLVRLSHSPKRT